MPSKITGFVLLLSLALLATACGAIATPRAPGPSTPEPFTLVPRESGDEGSAVSEPPTDALPAATATVAPTDLPPTSMPTEVLPTATNTNTPSPELTATSALIGDPTAGEALFINGNGISAPCTSCHSVDSDTIILGPSLQGIASQAGERVEGQSAEDYLRTSIVDPNDFLVPDTGTSVFAPGGNSLMATQMYADLLSEQEVDDLVAYLLTLE